MCKILIYLNFKQLFIVVVVVKAKFFRRLLYFARPVLWSCAWKSCKFVLNTCVFRLCRRQLLHDTWRQWRIQDFRTGGPKTRRRRRRGGGCGEGVSLSPLGRGLGRGCAPSRENFWIFHLKNSEFQCYMGSILSQFSCPFYSRNSVFGFQNLQMKALQCLQGESKRQDACWQQHLYEMKWFKWS